ncbi:MULTISPECIES: hypothetical protein [Burkholderia]|jgi:hypothetical protein|uniref:hypothetical protein n=1 Tax=Burkholderia TaxID=32008 RepID=UPI001E6119ED|nr:MULTISPECIES: hypothetical protein [Burkholderia]UEP32156.1 hypothetical protein LMA01_23610 [Burkholderia sp. B21-007]UEP45257.1 hypothetical protein LMA02_21170 [Burkholderia sp. B21-005]
MTAMSQQGEVAMISVRDKPTTDKQTSDFELRVSLPAGLNPAIVASLQRGIEDLVALVLTRPSFNQSILDRADDLAAAFIRLVAPDTSLIEERIRRRETMRLVFERGDWLAAEQINALQVAPPANKAQPASDWKRRGRIFGVTFGGKEYFPGYQFDAMCQPLPVIKAILEALRPVSDTWQIAAWFHFPNGWIAGTGEREGQPVAPLDALDRRDDIVDAARRLHGEYVA